MTQKFIDTFGSTGKLHPKSTDFDTEHVMKETGGSSGTFRNHYKL